MNQQPPVSADPEIDPAAIDPNRPLAQELEAHVADGFTLALAGDCILSRPISQLAAREPGLRALMDMLHRADASIGNLETTIFDPATFTGHPYSWDGDWPLSSLPACAEDLVALGFDIMARANNHALDWGIEGMRETDRHLLRAGLAHAGSGESLGRARSPRYVETPKGRVGLVSVATTYRPTSEAQDAFGSVNARPGLSGFALRAISVLPADAFALLQQMPGAVAQDDGRIAFAGRVFESGAEARYRHEMDPEDLAGLLRSVRQGKQASDLLVVAVHAHEPLKEGYPELPASFLKDLAHAAIDAGADAFFVSGIHHLGPMEIYRNRPIFYGLGNFIWSDIQEDLPAELFRLNRKTVEKSARYPQRMTMHDLSALMNAGFFTSPLVYETVLPVCQFSGNRLTSVTLTPVDLGQGRPLTESGIPRRATGKQAESILTRLADLSKTFGHDLKLTIKDGIGTVVL